MTPPTAEGSFYFPGCIFPRASGCDPQWIIANQMGLNALWLTEWLRQGMDLKPGMRVLDLACGKVLSSIFLANEYSVQVWADDLWIPVTGNRDIWVFAYKCRSYYG